VGTLPESDVELAERPAGEVHVGPVELGCLFRPQAGVIKRPEQCVVPGGRRVLAGRRDPPFEEAEELIDPLRQRRRQFGRGVIADVPGGVELIDRADQPDAERGLDLGGLPGLQEPVEPLEDLDVLPAGRGRPPRDRQVADQLVDVVGGHLPGRAAQGLQRPFQQPDVVADRHRAEPAGPPRGDKRLYALSLVLPRVARQRLLHHRPALHHLQA
jgi:hypothetical protein